MRLLFLVFLLISFNLQAKISASIDRKVINYGENIFLTIDSNNSAGRTPNLTILKRQFSVIGNVKTGSPYISNGKRRYRTIWKFVLTPKRSGTLNIPAISVNGEKTKAIQIRVIANKPKNKMKKVIANTHDILVTATIDKNKVYPGQMLTYTLSINSPKKGSKDSIKNYSVTPPYLKGAIIIPLSKPIISLATQRSKPRTISTQSYAIFARQPALYQIEPAIVNIATNSDNIEAKKLSLKANKLHFEVIKEANQNSLGYWIPTTKLTLSQSWQGRQIVNVGDSVKRIIEIKASSVDADRLPLISPLSHENATIILEDVVVKNEIENNKLIAIRQESITITFTQPGTISFEPIDLHWWNTQLGQARITSLSAQNFLVKEPDVIQSIPVNESKQSATKVKPEITNEQVLSPATASSVDNIQQQQETKSLLDFSKKQLNWLSIIMFLLLVATTLGWLKSANKKK